MIMKKVNYRKELGQWILLAAILIMPQTGVAQSTLGIAVNVVIHDGRFVIFSLTNFYPDKAFQCPFIRVRATVKDRQGQGNVVARRTIIARNLALPAGSREKQAEAGKEIIQELELQFEQPRIVDVSDPYHNCHKTIQYVTADKKVFRDRLKDDSWGPEMVWIPAGSFRMGDIQGGGYDYEQPVHRVSVDRFAMGRYEVAFTEYDQFAEATGRDKPDDEGWGRGNRPVINVSWNDATAYAQWLSQQTGKHYRLPTEAEWEYAARAGTETKYWWGNEIGVNKANCDNDSCGDRFNYTARVGSFVANPFGLYDTVGNVWEYVQDWFDSGYYHRSPSSNPTGPLWAGWLLAVAAGSTPRRPAGRRIATTTGRATATTMLVSAC